MQIVLKKIWLGEIGKIYRDSIENFREHEFMVLILLKMANFEDFLAVFSVAKATLQSQMSVRSFVIKQNPSTT